MQSPLQTIKIFQRLCNLNTEFQRIDWLRYAVHTESIAGDCWSIKQEESRIELHVQNSEALLLLWLPQGTPPPMDNIKPQWDTTAMVQRVLDKCEEFPHAIKWAAHSGQADWSSIWLATQWWPEEGHTDAVDDPAKWLHWWWTEVMEFTTELPSLYDDAVDQQ